MKPNWKVPPGPKGFHESNPIQTAKRFLEDIHRGGLLANPFQRAMAAVRHCKHDGHKFYYQEVALLLRLGMNKEITITTSF